MQEIDGKLVRVEAKRPIDNITREISKLREHDFFAGSSF